MQLTTKTRYSLRILLQLAISQEGKPVKGKEIADNQNITAPYLEQILITLKSAGMVSTVRGCNGGYILNISPDKITVLDIIELFEGRIEFSDCKNDNMKCPLFDNCPTSEIWKQLSDSLKNEAQKYTLTSIIDRIKNNKSIQEYII